MAKYLRSAVVALVLFFTAIASSAQIQWYRANSYAYKQINSYGYWTNWTDWLSCNVPIKFDLNNDVIVIYSNRTQIYAVVTYNGQSSDGQGGIYASYTVIDQDYDRGTIRLRIESGGNSQIYVDFANVMWVYNVRRTG